MFARAMRLRTLLGVLADGVDLVADARKPGVREALADALLQTHECPEDLLRVEAPV